MNTLGFASSSSANASLSASLTAISFTPLGVAYCLLLVAGGAAAKCRKIGRTEKVVGREDSNFDAGRKRREATMTGDWTQVGKAEVLWSFTEEPKVLDSRIR